MAPFTTHAVRHIAHSTLAAVPCGPALNKEDLLLPFSVVTTGFVSVLATAGLLMLDLRRATCRPALPPANVRLLSSMTGFVLLHPCTCTLVLRTICPNRWPMCRIVHFAQEDVRLPFFMTGPGVPRGVRVGNELQASMTDLTATLMWLAGVWGWRDVWAVGGAAQRSA